MFLPQSSLAGWVLVICAPLSSIWIVFGLNLVTQFLGDPLLLIAAFLLSFSPWLFVINWKMLVHTGEVSKDQLPKLFFWKRVVDICGYICFLAGLYQLFGDKVDAAKTIAGIIVSLPDIIGKFLVTTVLFTDILLQTTLANDELDTFAVIAWVASEGRGRS
jgi:hypothetical protein